MKLILENVRCFAGWHEIPIKPLTILTGENSSGKTTFLAMLSAVCSDSGFPIQPRFNEPPYSLGSFDTIASRTNKRSGRAKTFSVGYVNNKDNRATGRGVVATYHSRLGQPELAELIIKSPIVEGHLQLDETGKKYHTQLMLPDSAAKTLEDSEAGNRFEFSFERPEGVFSRLDFQSFLIDRWLAYRQTAGNEVIQNLAPFLPQTYELFQVFAFEPATASLSIAPIRTRPKRTYDEVTEEFNPEGDHLIFALARILNDPSPSKQKETLLGALARFGEESGLFRKVDVKKLGDSLADPFQVMVTTNGTAANLIDVGYGVSQALPVVVQSVLAAKERMLLLQQPEVHLHPRAQAALGSFFVDLVANGGKEFVIETHSDYILDRIRLEVAAGKLSPDAVEILFFERMDKGTTVHPLSLDRSGNILGAPATYREFFLREQINLLSRTGK